MLGPLAVHERPQGRIVPVLEGHVDVAVLALVLAELLEPVIPRAVGFAEGELPVICVGVRVCVDGREREKALAVSDLDNNKKQVAKSGTAT